MAHSSPAPSLTRRSLSLLMCALPAFSLLPDSSFATDGASPAGTRLEADDAIFVTGAQRISTSLHRIKDAAEAGYPYVAVPFKVGASHPPAGGGPAIRQVWLGKDSYDWEAFDERVGQIWAAAPSVKVILYLSLEPPASWLDAHPGELIRYEDESGIHEGQGAKGGLRGPSLASQVYIADASRFLEHLIRHVDAQPYRDRIAGIHLVGGHDGQWMWRGAGQGGFSADYGPAMKRYFADFLRGKYDGDVEKLRTAWHQPEIDFDTAPIPSTQRRNGVGAFRLRNPETDQDLIDYTEAYGNAPAELIVKLAETVKRASANRLSVGVYAGSTTLNVDTNTQAYGRIFQQALLRSPAIDFIAAPTYSPRPLSHPGATGLVHNSLQLHGKLGIDEHDVRTWLSKIKSDRENFLYGYAPDWERQRAIFLKLFARDITSGVASWQYDMHHGWFDSPKIWDLFRQIREIREASGNRDQQSVAEVAIVVDDHSQVYLPRNDRFLNSNALSARTPIGWTGAPYDLYFLDDITDERVRGYRCYVFLNTMEIDSAERARIHAMLKKNHATAVWVYAPGIVADGKLSTDNLEQTTGFAVEEVGAPIPEVLLHDDPHPLLKGIRGADFGLKEEIPIPEGGKLPPSFVGNRGPIFSGGRFFSPKKGAQVQILGELKETAHPGFAIRKMDGWTSIYSSAPVLSKELWRNIFEYSGVFFYSDDPDTAITVNRSMLSLYARTAGKRTLRLPRSARLREVFTNRTWEAASEFEFEMKLYETMLLIKEE